MERDCKVILDELNSSGTNQHLLELVKNVRDSQKHFYLFLQHSRNVMSHNTAKPKESKKSQVIDKQNILGLLTDFDYELTEYVSSVSSIEALKETKEKMFPYSNMATLDDFKKINSLALIIKLLKKENMTEVEEIKIKVVSCDQTFLESRKNAAQSAEKGTTNDWELSVPQGPAPKSSRGDEDSPTLKKLKELNKKYYSDKLNKKK